VNFHAEMFVLMYIGLLCENYLNFKIFINFLFPQVIKCNEQAIQNVRKCSQLPQSVITFVIGIRFLGTVREI